MKKTMMVAAALAILTIGGSAFALKDWSHQKSPVEFYSGHTHDDDGNAIGAPQHSGGTNRYGCHNASVPYHCH